MTIEIEILNPSVRGILQELEKLQLISISEATDSDKLRAVLQSFRNKKPLSDDEIIDEVQIVRRERFAK